MHVRMYYYSCSCIRTEEKVVSTINFSIQIHKGNFFKWDEQVTKIPIKALYND